MSLLMPQLLATVSFVLLCFNPFVEATNYIREEAPTSGNTGNSSSTPDEGASWGFPTSSSRSAFNSVDTLDAQWNSAYEKPSLGLWCKSPDGPKFTSRNTTNVAPSGSQAVSLDVSQIATTIICHLTLQDTGNPDSSSNSAPFTIVKSNSAVPQTWSAKNPTAPTASIATSELNAPTSTSSPSSSPPAPSTDPSVTGISSTQGLSTAAGVGIGVGVALLVTLLALGALLLYLHRRQKRKNPELQNGDLPGVSSYNGGSKTDLMVKKKTIRVIPGVYETVGNRPVPQELDASATTFARTPRESVAGSVPVRQNSERDQWSPGGGSEMSIYSSTASPRGRTGEGEGAGEFI